MSKRVLWRDYTAKEMDRGEGMKYHPDPLRGSSWPIDELHYDATERKFHRPPDLGALMENCSDYGGPNASEIDWGYLHRIGDGKAHKEGEPY
ncbi:MAG: hypothetical protein AAB853_05105, partial [Patescibacteria group bacterium]